MFIVIIMIVVLIVIVAAVDQETRISNVGACPCRAVGLVDLLNWKR